MSATFGPNSDEDLAARLRADTPGVFSVTHLNAAGAGLPPSVVTEAVVAHLREEARIGPHWAAAAARSQLIRTRYLAASLFGCAPGQIAFADTATRLWAQIMLSVPVPRGARILVSRSEWAGNILNLLKRTRNDDLSIEVIPVGADGVTEIEQLRSMIDERVAAICVSGVATSIGARQPWAEIGRLPRPAGCLYFLDASQVTGRFPISLDASGADVLVTPSRKWLRGPRGQAMAALSEAALAAAREPIILDQRGAPWTGPWTYAPREGADRFESYEFAVANRLGLGVALQYAIEAGVDRIATIIQARLTQLHARLSQIEGCVAHEDIAAAPAFLTFSVPEATLSPLLDAFQSANIAISTVGEDYARWELGARGLKKVLRIAAHAYTSSEEIERAGDIVAGELRRAVRTALRAS